jgi:YfiR/HmsC-like
LSRTMRATPAEFTIRNPRLRRVGRALSRLVGLALCIGWAGVTHTQEPPPVDTGAGAYVLGFIQYVRWPAEESIPAWQVCVPGAPGKTPAYGGRSARGKSVSVRPIATGDSLEGCHILDLTDAPVVGAKALLSRARKYPILTVGEDSAFCTAGGVVCFRSGDGASGFEINLSAAQEAGLRVNAQLLNLGRKRHTAGGNQ